MTKFGEWQPIETAPNDDREKLGCGGRWQGEIFGVCELSGYCIFTTQAKRTDWDNELGWWNASGADAYAVWVKPAYWCFPPEPPQ